MQSIYNIQSYFSKIKPIYTASIRILFLYKCFSVCISVCVCVFVSRWIRIRTCVCVCEFRCILVGILKILQIFLEIWRWFHKIPNIFKVLEVFQFVKKNNKFMLTTRILARQKNLGNFAWIVWTLYLFYAKSFVVLYL